ncbi:MAG: hypothetical protein KC535_01955 [Nanoarchaeota archaeon]|nr:hypothetical protein [Nanoarchaeota archaeon]
MEMIASLVSITLLWLKTNKKAQGLSFLGKLIAVLIGTGIIIGLIIFWTHKTNSNVDNLPDIIEGLS